MDANFGINHIIPTNIKKRDSTIINFNQFSDMDILKH